MITIRGLHPYHSANNLILLLYILLYYVLYFHITIQLNTVTMPRVLLTGIRSSRSSYTSTTNTEQEEVVSLPLTSSITCCSTSMDFTTISDIPN